MDGEGEAAGGAGEDGEEVKGGPGRRGRPVIGGSGRDRGGGFFRFLPVFGGVFCLLSGVVGYGTATICLRVGMVVLSVRGLEGG